jgi:hypothetical protein
MKLLVLWIFKHNRRTNKLYMFNLAVFFSLSHINRPPENTFSRNCKLNDGRTLDLLQSKKRYYKVKRIFK